MPLNKESFCEIDTYNYTSNNVYTKPKYFWDTTHILLNDYVYKTADRHGPVYFVHLTSSLDFYKWETKVCANYLFLLFVDPFNSFICLLRSISLFDRLTLTTHRKQCNLWVKVKTIYLSTCLKPIYTCIYLSSYLCIFVFENWFACLSMYK